jgi:hypothetical protein
VSSELADIRAAMADALKVIPGLNVTAYQQSTPELPTAHVKRGPFEYDQAFQGGVHMLSFTVTAYVALLSAQGAQMNLDRYLAPTGTYSIKEALEADTTLGGLVQTLHVTGANGEQPYAREQGGPVLGSDWSVQVWL